MFKVTNIGEQAGAELCQAQVKLGLAKIEIFFHLIENWGCLPFTKKIRWSLIWFQIKVVFHLPK